MLFPCGMKLPFCSYVQMISSGLCWRIRSWKLSHFIECRWTCVGFSRFTYLFILVLNVLSAEDIKKKNLWSHAGCMPVCIPFLLLYGCFSHIRSPLSIWNALAGRSQVVTVRLSSFPTSYAVDSGRWHPYPPGRQMPPVRSLLCTSWCGPASRLPWADGVASSFSGFGHLRPSAHGQSFATGLGLGAPREQSG